MPIAGAVLLWWAYLVLGSNLPWLLAAIGGSITVVWTLRAHREVAACVAIATLTAAAPAVTCVILIDWQVSGGTDMVAVLTGYVLVAPVPALIACMLLRPVLVTAAVNALLGSAVLLLGAATVVVLGDHGEGAAMLIVALAASVAILWRRHRRAAEALLAPLPMVNGWTDLGRRTLPDGSRIDRLLVGKGHAITCSTAASTVTGAGSIAAVRTAAQTARTLGLSGSRVQPVILTEQEKPRVKRRMVNDGVVAASVIVTAEQYIEDVTRLAPLTRRHQRRAVLRAALLPVPTEGTTA